MNIRHLVEKDEIQLIRIHENFREEFPLTDLTNQPNYLGKIVIVDDNDKIIVAGGVRSIAEIVAVSNKSVHIRERREAYLKFLLTCEFLSKTVYDQLHISIIDPIWEEHLLKYGFRRTKGNMMYRNIER
jgi:hypothetical protein